MAANHVLALEVVTSDGRFIIASPEENTDLYWESPAKFNATLAAIRAYVDSGRTLMG